MKKMAILSVSMGTLFLVGISVVTLSGINQLDTFPVKADPNEYSVTFDANSTVEAVDEHYAIGTTTDNGNKVGVVGWYNEEAWFTFNGVSFACLQLHHYEIFTEDAYSFSTITGFAISFSGKEEGGEPLPMDIMFRYGEETIYHVESGHEYKGLSIKPNDYPEFDVMGEGATVTSLTIWYSC